MSEKTDGTLAGIVTRLESLERVARNRGSLACDHLAEQAAGIRLDLEEFAAAAPDICSGHSAVGSGHMPTAAEAQAVAWSAVKPGRPGVYGVRGFNLCREPEEQFEAVVSVRLYEGDLICNLHEYTSEEDFDRWIRVEDCSDGFEWREFVPAHPPPSAPVGVAADILRIVDTAIDVCNDRDRPAMAEDLEAVRLYVEQASAPLAQQPAAVDEAADAKRYRALVACGKFLPSEWPSVGWAMGCGRFDPATKKELDAAADALAAQQGGAK